AILQPADVFLDLSGEDMRGRLLLASDGAADFCLRPEFTIPVSLTYLASPQAGEAAAFCCHGPVFRQRPGLSPEFLQAGLENFGRDDREAADAEILALALEAAGAREWRIHIGDAGLLTALLEKLALPPVWLRRIRSGLAKGQKLDDILHPVIEGAADHSGVLAALDGAKRVLLGEFFAVEGHPDKASAKLRRLFATVGVDLTPEMDSFDQRLNFLAARGIDLNAIYFSAGFARNLDYYTGFVFEAVEEGAHDGAPVFAGGRYDRLLSTLGAKSEIPAVGAAIWIER